MIELTGKVCLITGADEGMGHGLVQGFVKRGANVAAGLLDAQAATGIAPALPLQMDVSRTDEVRAAVAKTVATFGRIDVLINNAGIFPWDPAETMTWENWRRVLDVNLDGAWRCCEAVIPHFVKQQSGVIINVGSVALRVGLPRLPHYLASKGGIVGLTRGLARDLGQYGIRVNCIHPGSVQTPGELRKFPDQEEQLKLINAAQSLSGRITPADIEPVFAFLASPESAVVTGQCLTADKGWLHE